MQLQDYSYRYNTCFCNLRKSLTSPTDYSNPENWNVRHTVKDINGMLTELEKAYPEYAELSSIGKTTKENDIKLLTITNENSKKQKRKKVLLIWQISMVMKENPEKVLLIQQHGC